MPSLGQHRTHCPSLLTENHLPCCHHQAGSKSHSPNPVPRLCTDELQLYSYRLAEEAGIESKQKGPVGFLQRRNKTYTVASLRHSHSVCMLKGLTNQFRGAAASSKPLGQASCLCCLLPCGTQSCYHVDIQQDQKNKRVASSYHTRFLHFWAEVALGIMPTWGSATLELALESLTPSFSQSHFTKDTPSKQQCLLDKKHSLRQGV